MSNFSNSILTGISSAVLVTGLAINICSFVSTDKVAKSDMNTFQKVVILKKNTNEFTAFAIYTIATQDKTSFGCAWLLSLASSLIIIPEVLLYALACGILSKSIKQI